MAPQPPADRDDLDETTFTGTPAPGPFMRPPSVAGYRMLRRIGQGGMGDVWLAEQEQPVRRQVAIKVVKVGMDTDEVVARFEAERQALALMNHPNIAGVYDAGVTVEGRPYFAMEFVPGIPITEYCDRHRLDIRERLELFVEVCAGVQHAHQKGIIHRDIKPTNVLVTAQDGGHAPKIIDFGVAKATSQRLTEHTVFTELGQMIGTPEYMSPEQAEMSNLDIDTRTDVYSLGVLLYELLAGDRPFDSKALRAASLAEIQRTLREDDPPRPSSRISTLGDRSGVSAANRRSDQRTLERSIAGDLDWITMKALEKDRVRRYETAHALALDVQRHLNDEPVLAGPPGGYYRLQKLVRRHRGTFLAATAVAAALVLGVIGTSWALLEARRAGREAEASASEARRQTAIAQAVNAFLNEDLLAVARPSAARGQGKDVTVGEVLVVAAERIDAASKPGGRFAGEPLVEAQIRTTLGDTFMERGDYAAAEPQLVRALALRREALGEEHDATVRVMGILGLVHWRQSRLDEAAPLMQRAYDISRRTHGDDHETTLAYEMNVATILRARGRHAEAEPIYRHNLAIKQRALGAEHHATLDTMANLANLLQETGRPGQAEPIRRRELEVRQRVDGDRDPGAVSTMNNLANDLAALGRYDEAEPLMRRTLALKEALYGAEHPTTLNSVDGLARFADDLGRASEAEALHRRTFEGRTRAMGPRHRLTLESQRHLAGTLSTLKRFGDAQRLAASAATAAQETLGDAHLVTLSAHDALARALIGLGRAKEAEVLLRRQLEVLDEKMRRGDDAGEGAVVGATARMHLGMALAAQGRRAEAEPLLVDSVQKLRSGLASTRDGVAFVASFYEEWHRQQPDAAREERAADWRRRRQELGMR